MKDIKERVIEIVKQTLYNTEEVEISDKTRIVEDLGADSIIFIRLIVMIENEFDFTFDDDYLLFQKGQTLELLCNYINKKINENK
jgi:acyl carrier protein